MNRISSNNYPIVHPLRFLNEGFDFTQMECGDGIYLKDIDNRLYIDAISGLWNVCLGYNNAEIKKAIVQQLDKLPFVNLFENNTPVTISFAKELIKITPENLTKVAYTCTGSESVELAIKLCRKYQLLKGFTNKNKLAVLDISYHGTYYGSMSASGIDRELSKDYEPKVPGFIFLLTPFCRCCDTENMSEACLNKSMENLEQVFLEQGKNLAGMIFEPIIGSGGIIPIPQKYMKRVKELCEQYNVLLVFDEVATGFGRTGKMFAFEHYNIFPDILCLSKGINSGYLPIGAVLFDKKISDKFIESYNNIEHLSTQNGNPLACAAGLATIKTILSNGYIENSAKMGELLKNELLNALSNHRNFVGIRSKGLMIGIELKNVTSKGFSCLDNEKIFKLIEKLKNRGLLVYGFTVDNVTTGLSLFPPIIINESEVKKISAIVRQVFMRTVL